MSYEELLALIDGMWKLGVSLGVLQPKHTFRRLLSWYLHCVDIKLFKEEITRICKALYHNNIPYMVVGVQTVFLYGKLCLTRDIDITLGVDVKM
ncbi:MAG: hypothetical protein N3F66_03120 [Spirochaetes bacterium]|nr:hypothetical protein [Spirochaetota bacterium]